MLFGLCTRSVGSQISQWNRLFVRNRAYVAKPCLCMFDAAKRQPPSLHFTVKNCIEALHFPFECTGPTAAQRQDVYVL